MDKFYRDGDLIALKKQYGRVHIFWTDKKYGLRICRPSMVKNGKNDQWGDPLKRGVDPICFKDEVDKLGKQICKECLGLCPNGS